MSQYQKGTTNLDFTEAKDSEWQWHPGPSAPESSMLTTWLPSHPKRKGKVKYALKIPTASFLQCSDTLGYGMVSVDLYSAIITKVSNVLNTLVSGEKPDFQALSKGLV